ncbi:MAG: hypothetical protein ACFFKA_06965, partial [Candidatus Thorarchaeota archaeon]
SFISTPKLLAIGPAYFIACPNCSKLIIGRSGYRFTKINITDDHKCPNCNYDLSKDIIGDVTKHPSNRFSFF